MARNILGIGGITSFFSDDETPILSFQPGMDFDACRAKYWKPIEETNPVINRWIGRTTTWKGYKQMFPFHNNYLRHGHFITIFEGIDAAPAFLDFRVLSDFHNHVKPYKRIEEFSEDYFKPDQPAYVFSSYKQEEMLQRMSRSGFGYQLSHMKEKYIYKSIEYTHAEVVCSGAIPVFASSYGEMCKHRTQNIPLIECENNGTIWLDKDNMGSAYSLIDKLSKDDVMRDEWRNMAFEFYKEHQDSEYAFTQLMNDIRNNI
jgi:hypothetical protein